MSDTRLMTDLSNRKSQKHDVVREKEAPEEIHH